MDWQAMVFLGAYHGINPGMGWLFAVALGMQQRSARGVCRALPPIALGHAAAVGVVLTAVALAQVVVPPGALKGVVALTLMTLGLYRLWRHRHPRFGGMQVTFRDLTIWSFLMASAHGAGFMVIPFVMRMPTALSAASHDHAMHLMSGGTHVTAGAVAVGVHTLAYFTVMALTAWLVYWKLGLNLLRKGWFNLDPVWAGALLIAGMVVLFT
jgi:hypothetical protein